MFLLLKWVLLGPVVRWLTRMRVTGDLPRSGSIVIAANHLAEIDSLVLCLALRRRPTFVAKSEYFEAGLRGRLYGTLCRLTGQIPIPRTGGAETALAAASDVLQRGDVWAIYPEGTRSPDGRLYRGHTGVMRVALRHPDAIVVPVGITGTREVDPPSRRRWRRGSVMVAIGEPLDCSPWTERCEDPRAWREATDELMLRIAGLTGQTVVHRHPTRAERDRRDGA